MSILPQPYKPHGVIYTVTNKLTGKQYVGQTTETVEVRWAKHISSTYGNSKYKCSALHNAIRKYGPDAFGVEAVIACDSKEELDRFEVMAIKAGGTLRPGGYNLTTGGSNGKPSDETRAKMSESLRGRPKSLEHRAKLSMARKGRKFHSPESRAKIGAASRKRRGADSPRAHPVIRGDGIRFDTVTSATHFVGGKKGGVTACCQGRLKTYKGFVWRYAEEVESDKRYS